MIELKTNKARKALQGAICTIAGELDIDVDKTRECIKNYTKEKLLETFTEMKSLRLRQENLRLISLIKEEEE